MDHKLSSFITENFEPILNEREKLALHLAGCVAIESYRRMIDYLGTHDSTTRRTLEAILAGEEEHAEDLSSLLVSIPQ